MPEPQELRRQRLAEIPGLAHSVEDNGGDAFLDFYSDRYTVRFNYRELGVVDSLEEAQELVDAECRETKTRPRVWLLVSGDLKLIRQEGGRKWPTV